MDSLGSVSVEVRADLDQFNADLARGEAFANEFDQSLGDSFSKIQSGALSAGSSIDSLENQFEMLASEIGMTAAATGVYDAALDEINSAHTAGILSAQQYETALEQLNAEYGSLVQGANGATGASDRLGGSAQGSARSFRGFFGSLSGQNRFIIQNTANQFGDLAVQIGSGQSAARALGQQLPQLLGAFGPIGAILGTVSAIGVPLGASLFAFSQSTSEASKEVATLDSTIDRARQSADTFLNTVMEIVGERMN